MNAYQKWQEKVCVYREHQLRDELIDVLQLKMVDRLVEYLDKWNIRNVVVGVSGGIDSALVLALLRCAARRLSPKRRITIHAQTILYKNHPFAMGPIHDIREWVKSDPLVEFNVVHQDYTSPVGEVDKKTLMQLTYQHRYHCLFALAQKVGGITVGTTNFDEVGFAGWFGKTSDMMVDLQPIHDLHKCQVVALAKRFGLPVSIIEREPRGDLHDYSTDEQNFGCTYDELALVTRAYVTYPNYDAMKRDFLEMSSGRLQKVFDLHEQNLHKYQKPYREYNPIFL